NDRWSPTQGQQVTTPHPTSASPSQTHSRQDLTALLPNLPTPAPRRPGSALTQGRPLGRNDLRAPLPDLNACSVWVCAPPHPSLPGSECVYLVARGLGASGRSSSAPAGRRQECA